jgi:hypothetical protein
MISKTQKDPRQFIPVEDQQVRGRQILFSRTIDSDAKLIAAIELQLLERLEAGRQERLHDVIEHLRKLASGMPTAKISPEAIDHN